MPTNIEKYDFKEGLPHEFEIVDLTELYERFYEGITVPHRLEFYQILWFQEGTTRHWVDFKPIEIKENSLLFLNKNSVQRFHEKNTFKGTAIIFTDNFFCKTNADTNFLRSTILFNDLLSISKFKIVSSKAIFNAILKQMLLELHHLKDVFQADILRNHLQNFMLIAERERRNQNFIELKKDTNLTHVLQFKELLEANYIQQKQVSFYCNKMYLTPKRLNVATSKILDKTPKDIIIDRILLEAKRLLVHTNNSSKEIAFNLGFEEPTNFIKFFKKHLQKTPLQFRADFV